MDKIRVYITGYNTVSALGYGVDHSFGNLLKRKKNISFPNEQERLRQPYFAINYEAIKFNPFKSKVADLSVLLVDSMKDRIVKGTDLFVGTSTGGIDDTENNYKALLQGTSTYSIHKNHFFNVISDSIKEYFDGLIGSVYTISTACSSSAQALLYAYKLMKAGVIKRAVVLGVDILSNTTKAGFDSLKLVSYTGTKPLSEDRDGLNLGEGAGIMVLDIEPDGVPLCEVLGGASTTDGHHMSSPDPEGIFQSQAIEDALLRSGVDKSRVGYVSAHGTGTEMNDRVETLSVKKFFGKNIIFSSLKGFVGHTLGASALCELPLVVESLKKGVIVQPEDFKSPIDKDIVPESEVNVDTDVFVKNSFGFGGNNVSLVFKIFK